MAIPNYGPKCRPTVPSVWTMHERGKPRLTVAVIRLMSGELVCDTWEGPMRLPNVERQPWFGHWCRRIDTACGPCVRAASRRR